MFSLIETTSGKSLENTRTKGARMILGHLSTPGKLLKLEWLWVYNQDKI
jgi:hypothetical protein